MMNLPELDASAMRPIVPGDMVVPTDGNWLRSGAQAYDFAIVASLEPFIIVSEQGDMLWSTRLPENFSPIGRASQPMMDAIKDRFERDLLQEIRVAGEALVQRATAAGVVLTIEQVPLEPLAMRHYETRVIVRKARP